MRILNLLQSEELMVQEVMEVLGMAQSRVSRHLAILRDAGLLRDRRDGTYVFYRFETPPQGAWADAWAVAARALQSDSTAQRDAAALEKAIEARGERPRSFFDAVGPEWDALRKVFDDDVLRARAITRLAEPGLRVLDVGTGTGILAAELARLGLDVIGIDGSARMLDAAREKLDLEGLESVELRRGEAQRLPVETDSIDAAFAHMLLQYVPSPAEVIAEMARCVVPGGAVVVIDFVSHEQEWMRQELGIVWSGFDASELETWFEAAGLGALRIEESEPRSRSRDLPATFIASARVSR